MSHTPRIVFVFEDDNETKSSRKEIIKHVQQAIANFNDKHLLLQAIFYTSFHSWPVQSDSNKFYKFFKIWISCLWMHASKCYASIEYQQSLWFILAIY